ncbi:unnamed protein product [Notodromas monacha]|uniref:Uncharacterized protein n=1 Tax=Notodromas monacha TaxID=399045 RepID=A0A7R9BF24_9CRUS|nr:unnamed protein product [Notodromas monacha]CAG0913477.1 unnamed protein product [Notodromas monacha]
MACCVRPWVVRLNLAIAAIGGLLGLIAFLCFGFYFHNEHAAVWGLVSALLASVVALLHYLYIKEELDVWYSGGGLYNIAFLGLCGALMGLAGLIFYVFLIIYYKLPFSASEISDSYYIATVWSFMTAKWGMGLFMHARNYKTILEGEDDGLRPLCDREYLSCSLHDPIGA